MKTLYVSDMDGTLLDNDSKVSAISAGIISELSREGALITVATARTPATVEPLLSAVCTNCPAIVMTGAAMWNRREKRLVNARIFSKDTASEIIGEFGRHGINPFIYTVTTPSHLDVYYRGVMNRQENAFYQERRHLSLKRFHIGGSPDEDALGQVILMFSIGPTGPITRLAGALEKRGGCSESCSS